jgi:hypothetical protein
MDEEMSISLQGEIIAELTTELSSDATFNSDILKNKVVSAIRAFKTARGYSNNPQYYTDDRIEKDLYDNYYDDIKELALYRYNKIGVEGQESHSENGVSRSYIEEKDMFKSVVKISPMS